MQAYSLAGLSGGFVTFFVCASILPAWISFCLSVKFFGQQSLRLVVNANVIVITAFTIFAQINLSLASSFVLHCLPSHYNRFAYIFTVFICMLLSNLILLASVTHLSKKKKKKKFTSFFYSPGQQCFTYYLLFHALHILFILVAFLPSF